MGVSLGEGQKWPIFRSGPFSAIYSTTTGRHSKFAKHMSISTARTATTAAVSSTWVSFNLDSKTLPQLFKTVQPAV